MRVGILTLTGDNNYGNKLQNYALQFVLEQLGHDVETIRVSDESYRITCLKIMLQLPFISILPKDRKKWVRRRRRFLSFNRHIHQAPLRISKSYHKEKIEKYLQPYDYILYGSDQIWNTEFATFSDIYLGVYKEKLQNIAISASFGKEMQEDYKDLFSKGLKNFKALSVREEAGKDLIKELADREAEVLIDPTMMLSVKQWANVEKPVQHPAKYIVSYFLGNENKESVREIAREMKCEVVSANPDTMLGPGEFIYLIHHAEAVCTDSFHACVFSILYQTQFYVFDRSDGYSSMNSRISTLLNKMKISPKHKSGALYVSEEIFETKQIMDILENERKKFFAFLKNNMVKTVACYHKDEKVRSDSSSGGVYYALAKKIIEENGYVFAACYDENLEVVHREIRTEEEIIESCGSKYVSSHLGDSFQRIKQHLQNGNKVLFVGTPCQCAGLLSYVGKERKNLLCVDFVCHGVPSRVAWRKYLATKENQIGKIKEVNMRDKSTGWSKYHYSWKMVNDKGVYTELQSENSYMKGFVSDIYLRPSCYECRFKGVNRLTDITLGDYWGCWNIQPDMDDDKGTSLVLLHNEKGKAYFDKISNCFVNKDAMLNQAVLANPSISKTALMNSKRNTFFKSIRDGLDFERSIQ